MLGRVDSDGVRRNGASTIARVATPHDALGQMISHKVPKPQAVESLKGILLGTGALKVRLTEAGRKQESRTRFELQELARKRLNLKIAMLPPVKPFDGDLPEGMYVEDPLFLAAEGLAPIPEHDLRIQWEGMAPGSSQVSRFQTLAMSLRGAPAPGNPKGPLLLEDLFFSIGSPVAMSIELSEAGVADRELALEQIQQAAQDVGIPAESLHLGGQPVTAAALNREVDRAVWNTAAPLWRLDQRSVVALSGLVSILLAFVVLKSARLATIVLLVSLYGVLGTTALVPLTGGTMNLVLIVMPTLMLVLGVSAAVHVVHYWQYAVAQDPRTAIVRACKMASKPCVLASVTTAIGLASLATSPLVPVRNFGIYASVGCFFVLLLALYALPALLQIWSGSAAARVSENQRVWELFGRNIVNARLFVTAACLVLCIGCGFGLQRFRTETKVIRYFPPESPVVQDYTFLEENLSGIVPIETVVRFDAETQQSLDFFRRLELVRAIESRLRAQPEISGVISLPDFQPVTEPLPANASSIQRMLATKRARETERRIFDGSVADASQFLVKANATSAIMEHGGIRPFTVEGDELWRITAQASILSDADYGQLTADIDSAAGPELKFYAGASHVGTGMVSLFLRTQDAVLESLILSFGLAFGVIGLMMMVVLQNPIAGLVAMLPNLFPIVVVFGAISWAGIPVDIGTMITASVALGIAVDGTLHLLTWFREGLLQGKSREDAVAGALGHCGPAMFQTTAGIGVGLIMLSPADLLLVSRFGWLMSALIGVALVSDVVLLPALLGGWLGGLIEKAIIASQEVSSGDPPSDVESDQTPPTRAAIPQPHLSMAQVRATVRQPHAD